MSAQCLSHAAAHGAHLPSGLQGPAATMAPEISVATTLMAAKSAWRALEPVAATPFHTFAWHQAVAATGATGNARIIIGCEPGGGTLFVIPLVLERQGPMRILRWLSGPQASYAGGLFRRDFAEALGADGAGWLIGTISSAVPEADAIVLYNQRSDDPSNPFAALPWVGGAGEGFSVTLGPWPELYAARNNRRARHNDRRREKRLAELAPWQVRFTECTGERMRLMSIMFEQKSAWLRARGIEDFLADASTRTFLTRLASSPAGDIEPMVAHLDVGGDVAGVSFGLVHRGKCYSLITSITTDERLHPYSPGDILFRGVLEAACNRGLEHFDLGIGSTQQKLDFADARFRTFHTVLPLSFEGRIYAAALKAHLAAKRAIKENPGLWQLFQRARRLRRTFGGTATYPH